MENKLGKEMAFPGETNGFVQKGISKRFYAACMAMQGILSNDIQSRDLDPVDKLSHDEKTVRFIVAASYEYADELLKQENG